jgi:hypothetical protein
LPLDPLGMAFEMEGGKPESVDGVPSIHHLYTSIYHLYIPSIYHLYTIYITIRFIYIPIYIPSIVIYI